MHSCEHGTLAAGTPWHTASATWLPTWALTRSYLFETSSVAQGDRGSLVGRGKPSGGFYKRHMVGTLEYLAPEVSS